MTRSNPVWADDIDIVRDLYSVKVEIFDTTKRASTILAELTPGEAMKLAEDLLRAARGVQTHGRSFGPTSRAVRHPLPLAHLLGLECV